MPSNGVQWCPSEDKQKAEIAKVEVRSRDARTGATTYSFDAADQNTGRTMPTVGSSAQVTTNYFDAMGRTSRIGLPDNTSVTNVFTTAGDLQQTSGSRTYPTGYRRDAQGRLTGITNWTTFPSAGTRVTSWTNDPHRGFTINKAYPDATGIAYTYTPAGRLKMSATARGIVTTNSYNNAGEISAVTFSEGTPALAIVYDRRGRAVTNTQGGVTCALAFSDAGQFLSESYSGGPLDGISITNAYDGFLRRIKQVVLSGSTVLTTTTNGFDLASRLQSVSDGTNAAIYGYLANSPLVSNLTLQQNGSNRLSVTRTFDALNRLCGLSNSPSGDSLLSFRYAYNLANQRTAVTNQDNTRWAFQNDFLGQVTSGKKYWPDGTPVAGQRFEYAFDDIGNRKYAASGGDEWAANLRYENYTVNSLNQYTQRSVPGSFDVIGSATNAATVTVNNRATYRRNDYFRINYTADNSTSALWLSLTNLAVFSNGTNGDFVVTNTGNYFLVRTSEPFAFDADGNQTNDGRWILSWDAQNRLTNIVSLSSASTASRRKLDFDYDYLGRRVQKIVSTNNGSGYIGQYTNRFVHDGWNVVAILDGGNNLLYSFRWGTDASGTRQGAGGVGGLISMTVHSGTSAGVYFYCYDGNQNVVALISAADGSIAAQYEYGPFGQLIRATGPLAFLNAFRFSTKFQDDETGLVYYGYRFYNALSGRWLSRDPLSELSGANLYEFVNNTPLNAVDTDGRMVVFFRGDRGSANKSDGPVPVPQLPNPKVVQDCGDYVKMVASNGLRFTTIKNCNVIIFYGHGAPDTYTDGTPIPFPNLPIDARNQLKTPSVIANEPYSAAAVVACNAARYVYVESPIRYYDMPTSGFLNFENDTDRAWVSARLTARQLCLKAGSCCNSIKIQIDCSGLPAEQRQFVNCGREETIVCNKK